MYTKPIMENIDPALVQQFLENYSANAGGDGTASPAINILPESFITMLTWGFIALNVIAILFLIVYIIASIRKWRVQSAILDMHRDVKELKSALVHEKPQTKIDSDTAKIA